MNKAKVGDVFYISWGYDQTNVDFYRIRKLRGKTQAVIEPVDLKIKKVDGRGFMSQDSEYDPTTATLKDRDVFINDSEKGKIVKFKDYYKDMPTFDVGGHLAVPYTGQKVYESWYA